MSSAPSEVIELRQYTLCRGRRDELIDLFEREFIETEEAVGMKLYGLFRDAMRPDRFVWIRDVGFLAAGASEVINLVPTARSRLQLSAGEPTK